MRANRFSVTTLAVAIALLGSLFFGGQLLRAEQTYERSNIERGKYLVEEVAKCGDCHTPRDANGELDRKAWLQGGPIWIMPVKPIKNWAERTPPIAGLPGMTEAEAERVLENGMGPEGETLRPPMHTYHMNPSDAKAIIAYLNSLPRPGR